MIPERRTLRWLPVALLVIGAANHFWQVRQHQLSPWLGGGFGMFSTSDTGSARLVVVTAITLSGDEYSLTLPDQLRETSKRARGLPHRQRLATLASETWDSLADGWPRVDPADVAALKIEVWKTDYEPQTLRPIQTRIAVEEFDFPGEEGGDHG